MRDKLDVNAESTTQYASESHDQGEMGMPYKRTSILGAGSLSLVITMASMRQKYRWQREYLHRPSRQTIRRTQARIWKPRVS